MTERIGTLKSLAANGITGTLTEKDTNKEVEFVEPRMPERNIKIGDDVIFISVITPSGKVVAVSVNRPNPN